MSETIDEEEFNRLAAEEAESKVKAARSAKVNRIPGNGNGGSYLPDIRRLLPQSGDAEMALLGSRLLAPQEISAYCRKAGITRDSLHIPAHQTIFDELEGMDGEGLPIDVVTLTNRLRDKKLLDRVGGPAFLTDLFTFIPTAANAEYYGGIIEEKWTLREIIRICTEGAGRAYTEQDNVTGLLEEVETKISALALRRYKPRRKTQGAVVNDILDMIQGGDKEALWGMRSGFPNLDLIARGLRRSNVIAIGGEEKAGKTSLALNIINNVCVHPKGHEAADTLIFSLEMETQEVNEELLQIGSGFNIDEMARAAEFPEAHGSAAILNAARRAAEALSRAPLHVIDDGELNIMQMRSIARQMKPRVVVLDYAQLCNGVQTRYERDELRIAGVSRQFKLMCQELGCTGILLSQLTDGKAAGSRSIVKDCNQWWIVEDDTFNDVTGDVTGKVVKVCAGRRVKPGEARMKWIGPIKRFLPLAV